MNKMLIFPLAFMFALTIFTMLFAGGTFESTQNLSEDINETDAHTFSLNTSYTIFAVLTLALTIGSAAGFRLFGSGFSDFTQRLAFNSILYVGIWLCFTILSSTYVFYNPVSSIFWMVMTITFILGVGKSVTE